MDGVGTPIIGRPRPLPGHDTPNPANNTYTLNYEEPRMCRPSDASALSSPSPRYRLQQRSQCQRAFRQKVFVASNGSARSLSQIFGQ